MDRKNKRLGIFDSGIGGLSVLKVLVEKAPHIDVIYFGDVKNAPYGEKNQEELKDLTKNGVKILLENGAKNILSACNSISTFMIKDDLKELSKENFEIVEMIKPTVEKFSKSWVQCTQQNKIIIFATPATIESQTYQNNFEKKGIKINTFAIPELAGAIEFGESENKIKNIVERVVSTATRSVAVETALLCCTHYPFAKDFFEEAFEKLNKKVKIYDPAEAVVEETIKKFNLQGPERCFFQKGKIKFLISQDSPIFRKKVVELFSNFDYSIEII